MAIERSGFPELIKRNGYKFLWEEYDRHDPMYKKLFKVEDSAGAYEQSTTGIKSNTLVEKKEGSEITMSQTKEGFTTLGKNRTFTDAYEFTQEFIEDADTNKILSVLQGIASGWGEGIIATKERFAAKFFNYGGYTSGHDVFNNSITGIVTDPTGDLCYDNKPFFNLTGNRRYSKGGGSYYNGLALALSSANLQTAYDLMRVTNNRNERDEIVDLQPNTLLIPAGLHFTTKNILESEKVLGSGNNDKNVVQNLLQPVEWQYLTDSDAWFIGCAQKGLVWQERKQPLIEVTQDFKTGSYWIKITARWGARMENWRYWVGSNFSTS